MGRGGLGRRLGLSAPYDGSVACAALTAAIAMAAIASSAHRRRTASPPRAGSVDCAATMVAPEASAAKEKEESSTEVSRAVWPLRAGAGVRVGSGWRTWLGRGEGSGPRPGECGWRTGLRGTLA